MNTAMYTMLYSMIKFRGKILEVYLFRRGASLGGGYTQLLIIYGDLWRSQLTYVSL